MKATKLFSRNGKIAKMPVYTLNFGIPAAKTCPMKDTCGSLCYALKGAYSWPVVKAAYERRFQASKQDNFPSLVLSELGRSRKVKQVRIHDSGDFYNKEYLSKWFKVMTERPDLHFYAYTKQVSLLKAYKALWPSNFTVIFSLGGKEDHLIDLKQDRHSKIFDSKLDLLSQGYTDTSEDDSNAYGPNKKVGLVIH